MPKSVDDESFQYVEKVVPPVLFENEPINGKSDNILSDAIMRAVSKGMRRTCGIEDSEDGNGVTRVERIRGEGNILRVADVTYNNNATRENG